MSRLIITILSMFIMLMPSAVSADEGADKKAHVLSLFKEYKTSLKAGEFEEAREYAE